MINKCRPILWSHMTIDAVCPFISCPLWEICCYLWITGLNILLVFRRLNKVLMRTLHGDELQWYLRFKLIRISNRHNLLCHAAQYWHIFAMFRGSHRLPLQKLIGKKNIGSLSRSSMGLVRLTPYSICLASFFSRNSVFLSQQFSRNNIFQPVSVKFQISERGHWREKI